jgi:hypothetical protein
MLRRIFSLLYSFILLTLAACSPSQPVNPVEALATARVAWQADQHAVWTIDWPSAPLGGPLTAEIWRSGNRYRIEILEAAAPALVGETLVVEGKTAWRYNRFQPPSPLFPAQPILSPVTDLLSLVDQLWQTPVSAAERETTQTNYSVTQKIRLTFESGNSLIFWQEVKTGLPVRLVLLAG